VAHPSLAFERDNREFPDTTNLAVLERLEPLRLVERRSEDPLAEVDAVPPADKREAGRPSVVRDKESRAQISFLTRSGQNFPSTRASGI
jgi:hypothetical protein